MNSIRKPKLSRAGVLANSVLLTSCLLAVVPSWAGRDAGQMIAQDKANRDVIARRQAALDAAARAPAATSTNEALPLDHGPRATTTPWLNAQRRLRASEALTAAAASAPARSAAADK